MNNDDALIRAIVSGQAGQNLASLALQLAPSLPHETGWLPLPIPRVMARQIFPVVATPSPAPTQPVTPPAAPAPAAAAPAAVTGRRMILDLSRPIPPGAQAITGKRTSTNLSGVRRPASPTTG
jgi:hypothetical protein